VGATVVLYEGNPFHSGLDTLWRMAEEERISVFDTSVGYIVALKKRISAESKLQPITYRLSDSTPHRLSAFQRGLPFCLKRDQKRYATVFVL
jgi:acetoacetyl-CoA synthetase